MAERTQEVTALELTRDNDIARWSLEWWLRRLNRRLEARRVAMTKANDYYEGRQPLAFASAKFAEAFGGRFLEFSSNFMELVVNSHLERLRVQGIRYGAEADADKDAWAWWQRNHLDSESKLAHTEALVKGCVNVLVWPNADGEPEASIEDPLQSVVETAAGKRWKRTAALKRWWDDEGRLRAELYLPDDNPGGLAAGIYTFVSQQKSEWFSSPNWQQWANIVWQRDEREGQPWPIPNRIGVVPMIPIYNRPRIATWRNGVALPHDGQSDLSAVMSNQDAINKFRMDALVASEFAAFRQRWAIGLDIPTDVETGLPVEPFRAAVDRLWVVPPQADEEGHPLPGNEAQPVQFGEFDVTPLEPYLLAIRSEVGALASISRTPYHYFLGDPQTVPPSGESLRSSEAPLIAKVEAGQEDKAEGWEEAFRVMFAWRNDTRARIDDAELLWQDAERKTESEHMDALTKLKSLGVPEEMLWEKVPLSPQEIARIRRIRVRDAVLTARQPIAAVPATEAVTAPRPVTPPALPDGIA